ncbi:hypothetical protein JT359_09885 [Candidatus Poribacteria bacterium]|nr:hypothetical protein [Candidatus Poribacteria bacterium]
MKVAKASEYGFWIIPVLEIYTVYGVCYRIDKSSEVHNFVFQVFKTEKIIDPIKLLYLNLRSDYIKFL